MLGMCFEMARRVHFVDSMSVLARRRQGVEEKESCGSSGDSIVSSDHSQDCMGVSMSQCPWPPETAKSQGIIEILLAGV